MMLLISVNEYLIRLKKKTGNLIFFIVIILFFFSQCRNADKTGKSEIRVQPATLSLPGAKPIPEPERTSIYNACEQWYNTFLQKSGFNGGVLVAKNGNIIFERYKGTIHPLGSDSISAGTPFHIASVTKTFTAMAILKLWQEKKLELDSYVSSYLKGFNYSGVTVRMLLNHRSGLPNYIYFMEELGWDKHFFITNRDVLNWMIAKKGEIKNITTPNTHFNYCNTNYALLALIIETVSGISYPQYLKLHFFDPLGMKESFVFTKEDSFRITPSYDSRNAMVPLNYLDAVYGDKNIYSTPQNILLWDKCLRSNLFFTNHTLEEAYKPYSNERMGLRNYGLGWRMNVYPNGKKLIYHNGWWHGNNASFTRLLDEDATIIAVGNRYCTNIYKTKELTNVFSNNFNGSSDDETESESMQTANSRQTIEIPEKKVATVTIKKTNKRKKLIARKHHTAAPKKR